MRITEILKKAESLCEIAEKDVHPARLLMMDMLGVESFELYAMLEDKQTEKFVLEYFEKLNRYVVQNEPIQYIIGYEYFAGRNLYVDNGALIPRPETEELVYEVLFLLDQMFEDELSYPKIQAADIGTGSGAIAVSLAAEEPRVSMIATDISEEALAVAKKNAAAYDLDVQFIAGNMLDPLIAQDIKLDVLVSNPPYIPINETVQDIVFENEPHVALFGGNNGLYFYRIILENAHKVLKKDKYLLAFEIGFDQAERLLEIAHANFADAEIWVKQDMQGKDRMLFIKSR